MPNPFSRYPIGQIFTEGSLLVFFNVIYNFLSLILSFFIDIIGADFLFFSIVCGIGYDLFADFFFQNVIHNQFIAKYIFSHIKFVISLVMHAIAEAVVGFEADIAPSENAVQK